MKKTFSLTLFFWVIVGSSLAGSKIVKDNRLQEIAETLELGRGYSLANNRAYGQCFSKIQKQEGSFNLKTSFKEVKKEDLTVRGIRFQYTSSHLLEFLRKHTQFEMAGKKVVNVLMTLEVSSYRESLNEVPSRLDHHQINLLRENRFIEFYETCGPYFVKSIGKEGVLFILFKFLSVEAKQDLIYFNLLKTEMGKFYEGSTFDRTFLNESRKRNLNTNVKILGAGKGEGTYDLPSGSGPGLRDTLRKILNDLKKTSGGRISLIEIIPWSDLGEYKRSLPPQRAPVDSFHMRYRNLRDNSELVATLERKEEKIENYLRKTQKCHSILVEDYPVGTGEFQYNPKMTFFRDVLDPKNEKKKKNLEFLNKSISASLIKNLRVYQNLFYSGNENSKGGLDKCYSELNRYKLENIHYTKIPSCVFGESLRVPFLPIVNHYCLPELF